ncbi:MAG: hypothetical protein ACE5FL_04815 [Myxococcota bacterium]
MLSRDVLRPLAAWAMGLTACLSVACVGFPRIGKSFDFFAPPRPDDPFYAKIQDWQRRARLDAVAVDSPALDPVRELEPEVAPFGMLQQKFEAYLARLKRSQATAFAAWSQRQARLHFTSDPPTTLEGDRWPTLNELFRTNGDDCDGLDLIAYGLLRRAGFRADETYRLVIRRNADGANHMVTLWFEDREDPWVIDATGATTIDMVRFSDLPTGWLPRMMFNESEMYNVVRRGEPAVALVRDRPPMMENAR